MTFAASKHSVSVKVPMSRVLIVEDSPTQADALATALESAGFDVEKAGCGREGIRRFEQSRFDCVLSDVLMPDLTGYALCRHIRAHPTGSDTPVILISELSDPADAGHALECGADEFIRKPFEMSHVLDSIRTASQLELEAAKPTQVLVVEDSLTQAMELAIVLQEAGFEVDTVPDAETAYQRISSTRFDLVLTDLHLPGDSGFDLCRRLKKDVDLRQTLVVVLTAQDDPANILRGLAAGADDFMTKGRDSESMVARLHKVLKNAPLLRRRPSGRTVRMEFLDEDIEFEAGREQILEFLVSSFEDVVQLTRELKKRSGELSSANRKLEREVNERQRAESTAREASQAKSRFLAHMSHELRTPLNSILGYSEIIADEAAGIERTDIAADAKRISRAARHLSSVLSNILDVSRIEAGRIALTIETTDVRDLVLDLVGTIKPLVEENNNRFILDCPPVGPIQADLTKVRQVLYNLLHNACKFTRHGIIRLKVRSENFNGYPRIIFAVSDTGVGIPPDRLESLFEFFAQVENNVAHAGGGTGLGLAISRSYCRMMQGDLSVTSEPGIGSTFVARIPVQVKADRAEVTFERTMFAPDRIEGTVLLVDDDLTVHNLLRPLFADAGLRVRSAYTTQEGVAKAQAQAPSAIMMDSDLADDGDWSALAALKSIPNLAAVPLVLSSIRTDQRRGWSLGADDYVVKPLDQKGLVRMLRRYLPQTTDGVLEGLVLVGAADKGSATLIRRTVQREGARTVDVSSGRDALDQLRLAQPDLALVDLLLPDLDAFELIDKLHSQPGIKHIPLVVLTSVGLPRAERKRLGSRAASLRERETVAVETLVNRVRQAILASVASE